MSEPGVTRDMLHAEQEGAAAAPQGATAGQLLRQLREGAGVHIAALAVTLKVSVNKLEALEADRYDLFADAVFMRALASSACRALKADAAPVLALLPHSGPVQLQIDKGLNASFKESHRAGKGGGVSIERPRSRWLAVAVAALLVAALAIALLPQLQRGEGGPAEPAPLASAAPAAPDAAEAPTAQESAQAADAAVAQPMADAVGAPAAPVASAAPAVAVTAAAPAAGAAASEGPQGAPAADEGVLVIRAKGASWIQVRSATGSVVVERNLAAGESVSAAGAPPWKVVVGRADVTEVFVRGQPMDLAAIARENVARFEVK